MKTLTIEEIEKFKTAKGGWTKEHLAAWGIPWPPPKGWKKNLRVMPSTVVSPDEKSWIGMTVEEKRSSLIAKRTHSEMLLDAFLRTAGIDFKFQVPIGPYFADFRILPKKIVVEVDGAIHAKQRAYDAKRDRYMRKAGYKVLRFTNEQIESDAESVIASICGQE